MFDCLERGCSICISRLACSLTWFVFVRSNVELKFFWLRLAMSMVGSMLLGICRGAIIWQLMGRRKVFGTCVVGSCEFCVLLMFLLCWHSRSLKSNVLEYIWLQCKTNYLLFCNKLPTGGKEFMEMWLWLIMQKKNLQFSERHSILTLYMIKYLHVQSNSKQLFWRFNVGWRNTNTVLQWLQRCASILQKKNNGK
jgi:hypothetical protein